MKSSMKKAATALLAAALLAATPCTSVFGAQTYYVNDGSSTLTMADAYAIGASGEAAKLPDRGVYAATANGTQMLGGTEYDDVQPNIPNGLIRAGLAFGSTALDAVHLQTGSGFAFGYYDEEAGRVFRVVGSTAESSVAVVADTNVTVGSSTFGAYHIELDDTYTDFEAACAAAAAHGGFLAQGRVQRAAERTASASAALRPRMQPLHHRLPRAAASFPAARAACWS